jgi:hypothetical protein
MRDLALGQSTSSFSKLSLRLLRARLSVGGLSGMQLFAAETDGHPDWTACPIKQSSLGSGIKR